MWKKILLITAIVLLTAGLCFLLFAPVSNFIGKQVAHGQAESFDRRIEKVITADDDAGTGITEKSFEKALEKGEIDKEGYPVDEGGSRTSGTPVVFQYDLDRLRRDSAAYNEELKTAQGSKFTGSDSYIYPALDLADYGIFDGVYGYVSAPTIDMELPIYLGASDWNMSYGAAHMTNTSLPIGGADTNASVAGHTGYIGRIFFDNLLYLNIGDKIYVKNFWETLTYQVVRTDTVRSNQSQDMFIQKDRDLFSMFTCIPYGEEGFGRYFVVCERVK